MLRGPTAYVLGEVLSPLCNEIIFERSFESKQTENLDFYRFFPFFYSPINYSRFQRLFTFNRRRNLRLATLATQFTDLIQFMTTFN